MIPRKTTHALTALGALLAVAATSTVAGAIEREQVLVRAKGFAYHPWTATSANQTASCSSAYQSAYPPGDYLGLPYDWGGYMELFDFDQQIAAGYGAGSYESDGVLACTAGLDCSGFVSKAWDSGHWATASVHQTSSPINVGDIATGDIFNKAGYHMAMYWYELANGEPMLIESLFTGVRLNSTGWTHVDGYIPRRYSGITGNTASDPIGTYTNPIIINSFPYVDQGNTLQSYSDILDGCMAAPTKNETGPEFFYKLELSQPGQLSVSVQDDAGVDIDVHIYTSTNAYDCLARHDSSILQATDCGTYYVVADTFGGAHNAGAYTLTVDFTPSGSACGAGAPTYDFEGGFGEPCDAIPYCNPILKADTCLPNSVSGTNFCSRHCQTPADCSGVPNAMPNACCVEFSYQDGSSAGSYCVPQEMCGGGGTTDPEPEPEGDPGGGAGGGSTGGSTSGSTTGSGVGGGLGSSGAGANGATGDGWTATETGGDDDVAASSCSVAEAGSGRGDRNGWLALALLGFAGAASRRRRRD
jgi:MYXO-CTERM domain-containing protein